MRTFSAVHSSPHLFFPPKIASVPITRIQLSLPTKVECFQGKLEIAESGLDVSLCLNPVAPTGLIAEKEETKDVLTLFLEQQGLSNEDAAMVVNKSDLFLEHLISILHILLKAGSLTGKELTTIEIRDALSPYLEQLLRQHGDNLINMIEHFQRPSGDEEFAPSTPSLVLRPQQKGLPGLGIDSMRPKAMARFSETVPVEELPPHIIYLMDLGLDLKALRTIYKLFPSFVGRQTGKKVMAVVEVLLELGVPKSRIPSVFQRGPRLCGMSLSKNLIPTLKYYEELGVDKKKWGKVIYTFPPMVTYSRQKIDSIVLFLTEIGLSKENIGNLLTRFPKIVGYSVEGRLRPAVVYFRSLGVNVVDFYLRWPQTFTLSVENNLRPMTEFFVEKGFSSEEIVWMIERFGSLHAYSVTRTVSPKWEFFVTMGYPRSQLVKFPAFFGCSLERRIKPRYELMVANGVRWGLNQMLSPSDIDFNKALRTKIEKMKKGDR